MRELTIDDYLEKVINKNTREYLNEIISAYNNGVYRLSIVGLYTIVIFDILHKVIYLRDIYNNDIAKDIIEKIDEIREKNPYSTEWEDYLIYRVTENFHQKDVFFRKFKINIDSNIKCLNLFDKFKLIKFCRLKEDRNLCAHPSSDKNWILRDFNRDEVKCHIRNMFEIVFVKNYIEFKDLKEEFEDDLNKYSASYEIYNSNSLINDNILNLFYSKYVNRLREDSQELIFKYLWEKINKDEAKEKEIISFRLFLLMIENNKKKLIDCLKKDNIFLSCISKKIYCDERIEYNDNLNDSYSRLLDIFFEYHEIWNEIPSNIKDSFKIKYSKDYNSYLLAYFLDDNLKIHFDNTHNLRKEAIKKARYKEDIYYLENILIRLGNKFKGDYINKKIYIEFLLNIIKDANSYYEGSGFLAKVFPAIVQNLSKDECIKFLDRINDNNQFYDIGRSNRNYKTIAYYMNNLKNEFDKILGIDFNYDKYKNLGFKTKK